MEAALKKIVEACKVEKITPAVYMELFSEFDREYGKELAVLHRNSDKGYDMYAELRVTVDKYKDKVPTDLGAERFLKLTAIAYRDWV
jgi:F420-0:gamma-glutamyl ligase-like protein